MEQKSQQAWLWIYVAWGSALVGTLGSLFFSEIMGLPPCLLCWYQRICLYPLVILLAIGFLQKDTRVSTYSWPFIILGIAIAIYHNLLFYGVLPETVSPCTGDLSCTERQLTGWGFVSIPLLSLWGFILVGACMVMYSIGLRKRSNS